MKTLANKHKKNIKRTNKKYPLMEYFLEDKPIEKCSKECQEQYTQPELFNEVSNVWANSHKRTFRYTLEPYN